MPNVEAVLGPHAYALLRYGIHPTDEVATAIQKLRGCAPHLARLLEDIANHK